MYDAAVYLTIVLMVVSSLDYVRRAWIRETSPVLTTWILLQVMISLTCWMYWHSERRSFTANIGVNTAVGNGLLVLVGVTAAHIRHGTLRVEFDTTQRWCLVGGAAIVLFWLITKRPLVSYTLVQGIALVAYLATVKRLWRAERSSEPLIFWALTLGANLSAVYPAWVKQDPFSWIYLARAVPSTAFVIYLITQIKRRMAGGTA